MKNSVAKSKARQDLVNRYLDSLKQDKIPWRCGWLNEMPYNYSSKKKYRGVNAMLLNFISMMNGWLDPRWMTWNDVIKHGWAVKKGSKCAHVEYWYPMRLVDKESKKWVKVSWEEYNTWKANRSKNQSETENLVYTLGCKSFDVFNGECIVGIDPYIEKASAKIEATPFVDKLIENLGVTYKEEGSRAFYSPSKDMVVIPSRERFESQYEYDAKRLHELCHSTGHASRKNRDLSGEFGSESYAKEELRVEIAASLIGIDIDLPSTDANLDNHVAYIQSWIKVLENDPEELFNAISAAQVIDEYVLEQGEYNHMRIQQDLDNLAVHEDGVYEVQHGKGTEKVAVFDSPSGQAYAFLCIKGRLQAYTIPEGCDLEHHRFGKDDRIDLDEYFMDGGMKEQIYDMIDEAGMQEEQADDAMEL